jgi:hypothetical protein
MMVRPGRRLIIGDGAGIPCVHSQIADVDPDVAPSTDFGIKAHVIQIGEGQSEKRVEIVNSMLDKQREKFFEALLV